jgi:3-methyladenine DNA glycosylase AlkC
LGYFVSENGCNKKYLKSSLKALERLTKNFSVEDNIRFFINKFPKETFDFMKKMSESKNYHQRRLSSEGLRPKLPWCIGINFD